MDGPPPPPPPPGQDHDIAQFQAPPPPPPGHLDASQQPSPYDLLYNRQQPQVHHGTVAGDLRASGDQSSVQPPGYGQGTYQAQSQAPPPGYAPPQSHASAPMVPQYAHSGPGQAGHALPPPPMGMVGMQMGGAMQPPPAKKPAVPDWVRQELLKRGLHSDAAGVQAKGSSGSDGDEVAAKQPRRFTESGSGSASRWGGDAGIAAAKSKVWMSDSEEDSEAEAEEAQRRARIQMEVKKSLTHILLDVTDGLFDKLAEEVCEAERKDAQHGTASASGAASSSDQESDGVAADGAALLGLGYVSDGDSQDSGRSPEAKAGQPGPASSEQASAEASPAVLNGDQAGAGDGRSMSPATAAGGWVKKEEEQKANEPTFVKGQRLWYIDKDGGKIAGKLMSIDTSIHPPSYAVRIDSTSSIRETEGDRLQHMADEHVKLEPSITAAGPIPPSAPSGSQHQPQSSRPVTFPPSTAAVDTEGGSCNASHPIGKAQHSGKQDAVDAKVTAEAPEQAVTNGKSFPAMLGGNTTPAAQQSGEDSRSMSRTALESQGAAEASQSALAPSEEAARQSSAASVPAGPSSKAADKPVAGQGRINHALEDAGAGPSSPSSSKPAHATAKPVSDAKDEKKSSSSREDKLEKKSGRDSKRSEVDRKASKGKRHRSRSKSRSRSDITPQLEDDGPQHGLQKGLEDSDPHPNLHSDLEGADPQANPQLESGGADPQAGPQKGHGNADLQASPQKGQGGADPQAILQTGSGGESPHRSPQTAPGERNLPITNCAGNRKVLKAKEKSHPHGLQASHLQDMLKIARSPERLKRSAVVLGGLEQAAECNAWFSLMFSSCEEDML
ncbi:MAG: hypothetical protein FRX49_07514 [Trebouxia sp. A1-2]|nr:MAG: hypothetical protein FRX49_07514 [Trebouxia sp. A1-2]